MLVLTGFEWSGQVHSFSFPSVKMPLAVSTPSLLTGNDFIMLQELHLVA